MIRGKRPFHSSYDSRKDSHWDEILVGTSAHIMLIIIPAKFTGYAVYYYLINL